MICACVVLASSAAAQTVATSASLSGKVLADSTDVAIASAEVSFPNLKLTARTDSSGRFLVSGVPGGAHAVIVRRIGYEPVAATLTFRNAEQVEADFVLKATVTKLANVNVKSAVDPRYARQLADFESRRKFGFGRFVTSDVFEDARGQNLASLLVTRLPGVRTLGGSSQQVMVSIRGNNCPVQVVLNGLSLFNGGEKQPMFDINSLQTSDVIGVEYYTVASTPAQFRMTGGKSGGSQCGTVVIWTK